MTTRRNQPNRDAMICQWYTKDQLSTGTIASYLGLSREAVRQCLRRNGIERREQDYSAVEINKQRTA